MEMSGQELYQERTKRVRDAVQLRTPDRVPILMLSGYLPVRYAGMTLRQAHYDSDRYMAACKDFTLEFAPDLYLNAGSPVKTAGAALDALKMRQIRWPGEGIPVNSPFQFVEDDYLQADEYDAILDDLSDFTIRRYLPRVYGAFEPFALLPPVSWMLLGYIGTGLVAPFAHPDFIEALERLVEAAKAAGEWAQAESAFDEEMASLGFPALAGSGTFAPLDFAGVIRGSHGLMLDMFRQPDNLLALIDKLLPITIDTALALAQMSGSERVFMSVNRGADGLMSPEQFETFYFPSFKKVVVALVEADLTPCVHFQGCFDSRLEWLAELPKGKVLGLFDRTDVFRAKEVLGDTMCIGGNMPLTLLRTGSPEDVREYAKRLIDVVGEGGGFVMTTNTVMDDADLELVRTWIGFTKDYGVYG